MYIHVRDIWLKLTQQLLNDGVNLECDYLSFIRLYNALLMSTNSAATKHHYFSLPTTTEDDYYPLPTTTTTTLGLLSMLGTKLLP